MDKKNLKKIIITVCVILAAALIIGLAVYNRVSESGAILRSQITASSENYEVTGTMMSYFVREQYLGMASYASYLGFDTSLPLKNQPCSYTATENGTWFDYFVGVAKSNVSEILANCEAANALGVTLTDDDKKAIDDNIAAVTETAAAYGYSLDQYLSLAYGAGVKEQDVRACLELVSLASKNQSEYVNGLEYTDEKLNSYYDNNKDKLDGVDYISYTVYANDLVEKDADGNPTGSSDKASSLAKAEAEKLAKATSKSAFESLIRTYLKNYTKLTTEEIDDKVKTAFTRHAVASEISNISDWAFDAKVGETHIEGKDGDTQYTVFLLTKKAYRDDTVTRDVRHILFSTETYEDDTKANEVYEELKNANFSEEKFTELAAKYSEDTGSATNGGLYENVAIGDTVNEFNAWLYDSARKVGDHGIVKSTYGWHIMYYVGEGDSTSWKMNAISALKEEDYTKLVEEHGKSITYNDKNINKIEM